MPRRLFTLALITAAIAALAGLSVSAHAAGPVPETHYFFHQSGTPIAPAGDAGTYDVTAPTGSTPALAPATQGLGLAPVPTWVGDVGGIIDTLKVDVWQKAPVAAGLGSADYDVLLTVGGQTFAFPTFTSPVATGAGFDEVGHTFTQSEPNSPLPIDASSGPVSIEIAGHYSDAESVTTIAYDATAEPSGFAVNVPPPTGGGIPPLQQAAGTSSFTSPVVIPRSDGLGEPSINLAPVGTQGTAGRPQTIWITAPIGLQTSLTGNQASPVWRSDDGGQTFVGPITTANVAPIDTGLGGGDTDIKTDKLGNVYQDDLWLGDDSMSFSTDKGATWTGSPVSHIRPIDDRAWLAYSKTEDAMYMTYDGENGVYLDKALIGTLGPSATLVFQQETLVDNNATRGCICPPGSLTVDDSRAGGTPYVYVAFAANDGVRVYRSDDGGLTFTHTTIPSSGNNPDHSFTTSAVDSAGNLYVTWENTVGGIADVFYAWSGDHGATWNGPFDASALLGPNRGALFPAITADTPGHVGIAFYGTPNAVDPDTAPDGTQWNVYYLESADAASTAPAFTITNIEPNFHQGQICTAGLNCTGDRSLLDFFSVQFDANHQANIIYTQGGQTPGTQLAFVKQTTGGGGSTASTLSYTGDTSGTKGGTATYTALLSDANGNPISGATVSFQLGAQAAVTATTNGGGAAIATQAIGLDAGTYSLTASYAGDASHAAATATKQFVVSLPNPGFGQVSLVKVGPKDGGEPSIATGPEGNLYVSYPGSKMSFFRSTDQGTTWTAGGVADTQSGDTSVNVDSSGAVYQSNLNGIDFNPDALQGVVYKSKDLGDHWSKGAGFLTSSNSSNQPFLVDRQWADAYIPPGKTTDQALVYFSYHDWGPNQIWVNVSRDGGATFGAPNDVILDPMAQAASLCDTIPGGIKVVQSGSHAGRVYVAWLAGSVATNVATGCNVTQLNTFNTVWVAWSDDQGATWTDHLVFDGGIGHDASGLFADLTLDNQGNPYVGFVDNLTGEWDMYVMASFDNGTTWNGKTDGTGAPYKVNTDAGTHFFPAIAVGDPGEVDVAYIGAGKKIDTLAYGKPAPGGGSGAVWYLYMAQSLNLTSGSPTWTVERVTPQPMHLGDVCTLGIFCLDDTTGLPLVGTNRDLLDFIDISIGKDGFAHAAYTDDNLTPGIWSANQTSGSSVLPPTLALAATNPTHGAYTTSVSFSAVTTRLAAGTPVSFTLGTQTVSAPVGTGGVATATFTLNQAPGATTVSAAVPGLTKSAPFTVDKDGTVITAVRHSNNIQATLTSAGSNKPVVGRVVAFFVNGKQVGTAKTDSLGIATLKYVAPKSATVRTTFAGDTFFLASSSS